MLHPFPSFSNESHPATGNTLVGYGWVYTTGIAGGLFAMDAGPWASFVFAEYARIALTMNQPNTWNPQIKRSNTKQ